MVVILATMVQQEALPAGSAEERAHGNVLLHAQQGRVADLQGDRGAAQATWQEALHLARARGNRKMEWLACQQLSLLAWRQGDGELACRRLKESLAVRCQVSPTSGVVQAPSPVGALAVERGDDAAARRCMEENLTIHRTAERPFMGTDEHRLQVRQALGDPTAVALPNEEALR